MTPVLASRRLCPFREMADLPALPDDPFPHARFRPPDASLAPLSGQKRDRSPPTCGRIVPARSAWMAVDATAWRCHLPGIADPALDTLVLTRWFDAGESMPVKTVRRT